MIVCVLAFLNYQQKYFKYFKNDKWILLYEIWIICPDKQLNSSFRKWFSLKAIWIQPKSLPKRNWKIDFGETFLFLGARRQAIFRHPVEKRRKIVRHFGGDGPLLPAYPVDSSDNGRGGASRQSYESWEGNW